MAKKKDALKLLNELIGRKKSALESFKRTRHNFREAINKLPKGDPRKKGGNALSKKSFVNHIKYGNGKTPDSVLAGKMTEAGLSDGNKGLKDLKKQRKDIATGRTRFIRIRGRVIPIKG